LTVVVGLEPVWWDAAEFAERASVVEPVDPFQGGEFEVFEASPGSPVADEFGLQPSRRCQSTIRRGNTSVTNAM
jgi:hypothetical protein